MPEGPEVATIVADLQLLVQYHAVFVDTFLDNAGGLIKSHPEKYEFHYSLVGRQIVSITRRGKWILWDLTDGMTLVSHLGMFGSITLHTETLPSTRITLYLLGDGKYDFTLNYDDSRCFGRWYLWPRAQAWEYVISRTGPDAMLILKKELRPILRGSKGNVAEALVNQHLLSGIGNIYRAEILNYAKVSPFTRCGVDMDDDAIARIANACRIILQRSVQLRGSSIADYVDGYGAAGRYTEVMLAYGKEGRKCLNQRPACNGIIQHTNMGGRSLYFCDTCQKG